MLMRVCHLCTFFSKAEEPGSEAVAHTPDYIASMLAGAASFFAYLRSSTPSLQTKVTQHPYRALALAVVTAAVLVFGYRAWKKYTFDFDKALTDWVNEIPNTPVNKARRLERKMVKRIIQAYSKTSEIKLDLSSKQLTSLPSISVFQSLPHLKKLDLSFNKLESIPEELGKLFPKLDELNLIGNQLTTLPESFSNLKISASKISWLWLRGNKFKELPKISNSNDLRISIALDDRMQTAWSYFEIADKSGLHQLLQLSGTYGNIHKKYDAYRTFVQKLRDWYQKSKGEDEGSVRKEAAHLMIHHLKQTGCNTLNLDNLPSTPPLELFEELKEVDVEITGL